MRTVAEYEKLRGAEALTEGERDLIAAVRAGEDCELQDDPETVPDADNDPKHTIRADLLALLITGGTPECRLSPYGVDLYGAYITGELRLTHLRAVGETGLSYCRFEVKPDLRQAQLKALDLTGSHLPGLFAQGVEVVASMFLRGVTATGTVDVNSAKIGVQLDCDGAKLNVAVGKALLAQCVDVREALFLSGVIATGTVDVMGAKIGGQLNCEGATLDGAGGAALNAQGVDVGADLFLNGVIATGTVDMNAAKIGGQLDCTGATLDGEGGKALNMQRARVTAGFVWRDVAWKAGHISLAAAHVGDLWDDVGNWPDDLDLDGFTYDRLFDTTTRAKDRMDMLEHGSTFEDQFSPQPYTQLAKVLREMGHMGEARKVLFERQKLLAAAQYWEGYRRGDGTFFFR